jgi:hypothetical protein
MISEIKAKRETRKGRPQTINAILLGFVGEFEGSIAGSAMRSLSV